MFIVNYPQGPLVNKEGLPTKPWENFFQQQEINMQQSVSDEGFLIPSVSSQVIPPATQSNLQIIQNSFNNTSSLLPQQNIAMPGLLVFDPYEVNGGSSDAPLGQLKVLLNDGVFHKVTNT